MYDARVYLYLIPPIIDDEEWRKREILFCFGSRANDEMDADMK